MPTGGNGDALLEELEQQDKLLAEKNKKLEETLALDKDILETSGMNINNLKTIISLTKDILKIEEERAEKSKKESKKQKKERKEQEKHIGLIKGMFSDVISGEAAKAAKKGLTFIGDTIEKELVENMKSAAGSAKGFGATLKAVAGPAAALAIFLLAAEIFKLAVKVGNAENAFMKATGANQEFARSLSNSYEETRKFGASVEETSASMQSLFTGFTDFTFQNEKTRESLTNTATVLEKLGVSNQDFAASIQIMTKAMGMNADAAGQQMLNLEKFAEELGVAPSKLSSDFAGAGNMLAKMGSQGSRAFKDLAIASKITGLEMQKMLNITDKFDTFEGAAAQAGKLNAALGGNFVNAMDLMMETDPAARFEMIRDSILDAGLSFDEMTYYQKNFYKEALGLQDVGDLALMLSGNMASLPGAIQKTSQEYEEAAERAKTVASFQEQLNMLFVELIPIVTPVIDMFRSLIKALQPLAPILGGIGEVFKFIFGGVGKYYTILGDLIGGIDKAMPILKALGVVIGIIAIAFAAWSSPIFLAVTAIILVMSAIGHLIDLIFHERNSPTFFEGLRMMPDMFSNLGGEIEVTSSSMRGMATTMKSTPIPAAAETMAGTSNNRTTSTVEANNNMQTIRQPVEIKLNGDKLEKFVVEVTGRFIKNISLIQ